jgi:hypothetical protein
MDAFWGDHFYFWILETTQQIRAEQSKAEQQQQQTYHQSVNEFFWNFIPEVARLQFLGD